MVHFSIDATPAITDEVRELQEDAGTEGLGTPAAGGGRPHDHGRPLRRPLEGGQGRASPGRRRHACFAFLRSGNGSRYLRRNRKRGSTTDDEATLHSARAARRRTRVSRRRLRRRRRTRPADTGGATTEEGGAARRSPATSASSRCGPAPRARPSRPSSTASPRRTRTSRSAYKSAAEPATVLSTSVEGGNPPDIAALPQPGFMTDFAQRGALKPIDVRARTRSRRVSPQSWLDLGTVDGKLYGLFFKGANKSTIWYNVPVFEDAGVEPAANWDDFLAAGDTIASSGVPPYSIGGADGWTLTDLFENIYLRAAGPGEVRPADEARDSLDRSVGDRRADARWARCSSRTRSPAAPRTRSRPTSRPR